MLHKKQLKRKRPLRADLSSSEENIVSAALHDLKDKDPSEILSIISEPRLAQRFIEELPLNNDTPISILSAFHKAFADKNTRKAVSRAVFKLKSRGIPVDEFYIQKGSAASILLNPGEKKAAAYIGPYVLGKGTRPVLIIKERTGPGQDIAVGLVSDEEGFNEFIYNTYSRKDVNEVKKELTRKSGALIETSVSHAATVFEEAYRRHLELNSSPPFEYLDLRPWLLENASPLDKPIIYDFITGELTDNDPLSHTILENLFNHKLMQSWAIAPELITPYIEEILKIDQSPLVLSHSQKIDRISQIKEKASEEFFSGSRRLLWKCRLEEMAFIFFKLKENEYVQICIAAANSMENIEKTVPKNPVIEYILERSIALCMGMFKQAKGDKEQEGNSESGILLPQITH